MTVVGAGPGGELGFQHVKPAPGQRCHSLTGSHSCFPDPMAESELRKSLPCSLQNVMFQMATIEPTKAVGVAGSIEGGD